MKTKSALLSKQNIIVLFKRTTTTTTTIRLILYWSVPIAAVVRLLYETYACIRI